MKQILLHTALQFLLITALAAQLTINVKIPTSTPDGDIYIAGNFNSWNPKNAQYKLAKKEPLIYAITINPPKGNLEFKFTRGSWDNPEGTALGGYLSNRTFNYSGLPDTLNLEVKGWEDIKEAQSTASKNVLIDNASFYMKSLNRYRRVWLYLPPDYNSSSKSYPVIYMHDGQNLFDKKTSFAGEWQVDETFDKMYAQGKEVAIIVGIDNGGGDRINEYSPWVNATYGGGQGDKYLSFIVDELKPYIDARYRTKKDKSNTGMIGSSMAGLISFYAGVKYPEVFGKVAPLSSSYWFSPKVYDYASLNKYDAFDQKMYMMAGGKEGGSQVSDMYKMKNLLIFNGYGEDKIKAIDHPQEGHNEAYWASQFETIFTWLFSTPTATNEISSLAKYNFLQDSNTIYFKGEGCEECRIYIINLAGQTLYSSMLGHTWQITKAGMQGLNKFALEQKGRIIYTQTLFTY